MAVRGGIGGGEEGAAYWTGCGRGGAGGGAARVGAGPAIGTMIVWWQTAHGKRSSVWTAASG
jgi:hypothetical protein